MKEYARFKVDGVSYVHLMQSTLMEYSLCGYPFDEGESHDHIGRDHHECITADFETVKAQVITCPPCIKEILNCRGVKVKAGQGGNHDQK